jgi:hypothetical protein
MREGNRSHLNIFECLAPEKASELLVLREPEDRRPYRNVLWRGRSRRRNRIDKHTEQSRSPGNVPDGQRKATIRIQNSDELSRRLLGAAHVEHDEVPDDRIERAVWKRKRLDIAAPELDSRMQPPRKRNHRLGYVHPDDIRAALSGYGGHIARPRGDV